MSSILDLSLYESGEQKIQWVRGYMPLLSGLEKEFENEKPVAGVGVAR